MSARPTMTEEEIAAWERDVQAGTLFGELYVVRSEGRPRKCALPRPQFVCVCGKQMVSGKLCYDCRRITLPCSECGEPVKRLASDYASRQSYADRRRSRGQPAYKGRVFCNRICLGRFAGKHYGTGRGQWEAPE